METVAVVIHTWYDNITVATCYLPPHKQLLVPDMEVILGRRPQTVAIGDFKAKSPRWNSKRMNPRSRRLVEYLEIHEEVKAYETDKPTHYPNIAGPPDVLDIALLKAIPIVAQLEVLDEGSTSHNPILLTLGEQDSGDAMFTHPCYRKSSGLGGGSSESERISA